jgi:hypothetical protein
MLTKKEAIEAFGSATALAKALGITVQAIGQWGEFVPALRAYQVRDIVKDRKR